MFRTFSLLSLALVALLCAPVLMAAPADADLPTAPAIEAEGPQLSSAAEGQEAPAAQEPAEIEDFGKNFGDLLPRDTMPAFCPHNQPCIGGMFCPEYQKCAIPTCVSGKCVYE